MTLLIRLVEPTAVMRSNLLPKSVPGYVISVGVLSAFGDGNPRPDLRGRASEARPVNSSTTPERAE